MTHNNSTVIDQWNLLMRYNQRWLAGRFKRLYSQIRDQALFPDILLCGQIAQRLPAGACSLNPGFTQLRNFARRLHCLQWCFWGVWGDKGRCMSRWCNVFIGKKMEKSGLRRSEELAEGPLINYSISSSQTNTLTGCVMNPSAELLEFKLVP